MAKKRSKELRRFQSGGATFSLRREEGRLVVRVVDGPKEFLKRKKKNSIFSSTKDTSAQGRRKLIERVTSRTPNEVIKPKRNILSLAKIERKNVITRKNRTNVVEVVSSQKRNTQGRVGAVFTIVFKPFRKRERRVRQEGFSPRTRKAISRLTASELAGLLLKASTQATKIVMQSESIGSERIETVIQETQPFYLYTINKRTGATQTASIDRNLNIEQVETQRRKAEQVAEFRERFR